MDALSFLAAPFAMCVVLAGIHCYLGFHVLAREVIFVDLSLAQIAAFGATLALSSGFNPDSPYIYFFSLIATLIAAFLFAIARRYEEKLSQEAIIGIVYALGSASVVLLADNMSHGAEHIKQLLVGQILWVSWADVIKTAFIYILVGIFHYIFRRQLINSSFDKKYAGSKWDFLFYALFGLVITSSVQVAGVLQVFSFLIVPALTSTFFFSSMRARIIFGWIFATVLSFVALSVSFLIDAPSGAFIVVCFSSVPILLLMLSPLSGSGLLTKK